MSVDILKLKALATAAKRDQYDNVALNDYGIAMAPAVTLELIAEIERHRQVNAEGCKPDLIIVLSEVENRCRAIALEVLSERLRQITVEGHTAEADDLYTTGQLADAASALAAWAHICNMPLIECTVVPALWPWGQETWKPGAQRGMLIKAGALILAELERLDRLEVCE